MPPDNYPLDGCARIIARGQLPRDNYAMAIPSGNWPQGKSPFGWFMSHIIAPRTKWSRGKLSLRETVLRINYIGDIFSPRIRNLRALIDSFFLLFPFFVVYIGTKTWLLYKKKFYKHRERLNLLKKEFKSRTNWVWNNETDLFMLSQQIEIKWQGLPSKSWWNSVQKKVNCQFI